MRISVKARYALAATISMAQEYERGTRVTIIKLSEKMKISKIYLEQVFSLLKRADIVVSTKGPQGGYQLAKKPALITTFDILVAVEQPLFEKTEKTVSGRALSIEKAMQMMVFERLDISVKDFLENVSLATLAEEAGKYNDNENYMFYI